MGEGDNERANSILGSSTALLIALAVVATAVFQIWKEPLLLAFGATENTIGYASDYLSIYLWGSISVLLALGLNSFVTAQGFSTFAMLTVVIGAAINIALDPLFIFVFDMGVRGRRWPPLSPRLRRRYGWCASLPGRGPCCVSGENTSV